jgi:hypothetical protein
MPHAGGPVIKRNGNTFLLWIRRSFTFTSFSFLLLISLHSLSLSPLFHFLTLSLVRSFFFPPQFHSEPIFFILLLFVPIPIVCLFSSLTFLFFPLYLFSYSLLSVVWVLFIPSFLLYPLFFAFLFLPRPSLSFFYFFPFPLFLFFVPFLICLVSLSASLICFNISVLLSFFLT